MSARDFISHASLLIVGLCAMGCAPASPPEVSVLRLAVTTSTRDSGLLEQLLPAFEESHEARVDVIAVGTGAALKLGETGDVDVVLVHARQAEDAFIVAGHGARREDVMYNTFEILGPPGDPAELRERTPIEALQAVAESRAPFVSRGDDSGTHKREVQLWDAGGGRRHWDTYVETGQGMGATLTIADQMSAYVLTDRGTYLKFRDKIELRPLVECTPRLHNPYGVLVVDPMKHPDVNGDLAESFVDFLISNQGQQLIRDYRLLGEPVFIPLRLSDDK